MCAGLCRCSPSAIAGGAAAVNQLACVSCFRHRNLVTASWVSLDCRKCLQKDCREQEIYILAELFKWQSTGVIYIKGNPARGCLGIYRHFC